MNKKIVACLDLKDGKVVKGVNFESVKDVRDPVEAAKAYCEAGADEIVFLDITATVEGRKTMLDVIHKAASAVSVPLTIGGGIYDLESIKARFDAGASKVGINTAAVKNPNLIKEAAEKFGGERIVVAIDAKNGAVYINGGMQKTDLDAVLWAREVEKLGAGEILLTSIERDGTKAGFDIEITKSVAEAVKIPVTASGGAGKKEDFLEVLTRGKAAAALAASLFHFKEIEIPTLKKYLKENGVQVKI